MKAVLIRVAMFACVLLLGVRVRAQVPNPVVIGTGSPLGAVSADLNGDGRADLVLGDGTVLLGNADGTFTTTTTISLGTTAQNCLKPSCPILFNVVAVGDFNGDGKPDILVQQAPTSSTGVSVFPGNGDGTFGSPINSNPGVSIGIFAWWM